MAEALIEAGPEGRLATWTLEMAPAPDGTWRLTKATTSGIVDGLFHLELDPTRAFRAHDLVVLAEDFELRLPPATCSWPCHAGASAPPCSWAAAR
jgi:hypothetical protein